MIEMNPKVDAFLARSAQWSQEMTALREMVLDCGLTEELKWGVPCYTHHEANVLLIHGFKEYCAILFVKGALLKDPAGILVRQTENVQAARQVRFSDIRDIVATKTVLNAYIREAIEIEEAGMVVPLKDASEVVYPPELVQRLASDQALKVAFDALTPGRRRAYALFISAPKQDKTRLARIDQSIPKILSGKGPNE